MNRVAAVNGAQWNLSTSDNSPNGYIIDNVYEKDFESFISDDEEFDENDREYQNNRIYQPDHEQPDDDQQLNEIFIDIPPPNLHLEPCPVCSRKFATETLRKHIQICEKINTKKRKPFDSSKQRLDGTEFISPTTSCSPGVTRHPISKYDILSRISPPKMLQRKASETSLKSQPTTSAERRNMFDFLQRKSSNASLASSTTTTATVRPLLKRLTSQQQSEKCPHCDRVFGFKAYDRHVEWCKEKSLIKASPDCANVSAAKERLKTRTSYRAPNLRTRRSSTRDKYSNSCNGSMSSLADLDSHLNSMSSSMTSDCGATGNTLGYDPFLSAKRQLEELFSPSSTTPTTQMINSMMNGNNMGMLTPTSNGTSSQFSSLMTKSMTTPSQNPAPRIMSPKTPQPVPKAASNFKRTSSLRISNRKPRPVYMPPVKSSIQRGISDEGPISPNYVKATDYDELPIKSPYSAIKMCEQQQQQQQQPIQKNYQASLQNKPLMRDRNTAAAIRKNLKLDIKNPNAPATESTLNQLSKTDSLALFLKYESELSAKLSEKELKDKSNTLSKRSQDMLQNNYQDQQQQPLHQQHQKLPDINGHAIKIMTPINQIPLKATQPSPPIQEDTSLPAINSHNIHTMNTTSNGNSLDQQRAPLNQSDNLSFGNNENRQPIMSPPVDEDSRESSPKSQGSRRGGASLRRKMKLDIDNILFDKAPETSEEVNPPIVEPVVTPTCPEPQNSTAQSVFEDFDFDQFVASFHDDDQYPIFKEYKKMLGRSTTMDKEEDENSIQIEHQPKSLLPPTKPMRIQPMPVPIEDGLTGVEKLDSLCKMLSDMNPTDSDESSSKSDSDPIDQQTTRSKSSADSAYGSLSRQSQSPFDHRKMSSGSTTTTTSSNNNYRMGSVSSAPAPPIRQHMELRTTDIVLNPLRGIDKCPTPPPRATFSMSRSTSREDSNEPILSKFCHECGYKFVVPTAKFCIECGIRRIRL